MQRSIEGTVCERDAAISGDEVLVRHIHGVDAGMWLVEQLHEIPEGARVRLSIEVIDG